jgi:signal transduction histidine kinase
MLIIGLASMWYLLRLEEKTGAIYFIIIILSGLTLGMASWLANGIVFWGGALLPFTDACAVISMTAVIVFAYEYPTRVISLEARLARLSAALACLAVVVISLFYAGQFLIDRGLMTWKVPPAFWALNPAASLAALAVCLRRIWAVQWEQVHGDLRKTLAAFWHPAGRPVRLLRNFSLALFLGIIQGVVSNTGQWIKYPGLSAALLINLSFSLMFVVLVYSVFDLLVQQPRLVVRLVGLSLVTVLGVAGIVGMYAYDMAGRWTYDQVHAEVVQAQRALGTGDLAALPEGVAYILAWPANRSAADPASGRLILSRSGSDTQSPAGKPTADPDSAAWNYFIDVSAICREYGSAQARLRYGSHPRGSYFEYVSCLIEDANGKYEIGFSLTDINRDIQEKCNWVFGLILGSSLLVLAVFPRFFRANLIRPLDQLSDGVRQADDGDLDVQVPVTYQDEVGFLTTAFNKMIASLKQDEAELRRLNLTLEQRVADRTHELEALYDVTAAASQAQDSPGLLSGLLERSLAALNCPSGLILLLDADPPPALRLVASRGLPDAWLEHLLVPSPGIPLLAEALRQRDPLLIPDLNRDERAPAFMRDAQALTLILAPLSADGQMLGLMGLARESGLGFNLDEVTLLVSIVAQVGVAVHTDRLRQLAQRARVLEERERLAHDLHDSVTQTLYGLATLTEAGKMRLESGDLQASAHLLTRIAQTARQAIREMRLFLHQLRLPALEEEGLVNAIELRLAAVEGRSDVRARLEADEDLRLPPEVETCLYYITQEALNNALKHAAASEVTVRLARAGRGALLEVEDNGRGFDPAQARNGGIGLDSMRVRAKMIGATMEIHTRLEKGTRIMVLMEKLP